MIALLILLGCGASHHPDPVDTDRAAITATIDAWNSRSMPTVGRHARILVRDARDAEESQRRCQSLRPCAIFVDRGMRPGIPLIFLPPNVSQRRASIVHETLHHLFRLAGMGHMDDRHLDPRVWCDYSRGGCTRGSVEFDANAAMRERGL